MYKNNSSWQIGDSDYKANDKTPEKSNNIKTSDYKP